MSARFKPSNVYSMGRFRVRRSGDSAQLDTGELGRLKREHRKLSRCRYLVLSRYKGRHTLPSVFAHGFDTREEAEECATDRGGWSDCEAVVVIDREAQPRPMLRGGAEVVNLYCWLKAELRRQWKAERAARKAARRG